ncbi:hypothetical protein GCM10027084_03880 [Pseudoxanthomonas sangjuensis]|uniref:tetratricopeptide repeat protein n=1 Tax=Pseudoxanthomonas sangjuensis TaxID=1503750 RepID=UPI0013914E17|nr:glycosyltransferase family 39 protein [Pseudoxanthomonas sangjuensis]
MSIHPDASSPVPHDRDRRTALAVLALVALLRFVHLLYALQSPLTFQIGPDEDYYRRFGLDVAFGSGGMTPEFGFMDPLYGYLLGLSFKLAGGVFPIYLLQVATDVGTAFALILIAREFGRPKIGLVAAAIYAALGPAMAFTMMLLKTTLVTAWLAWWVWFALRVSRTSRLLPWLGFGLYCGIGVALRANLLLMAVLALAILPALRWRDLPHARLACACALFLFGLSLPLAALTARNVAATGRWSFVPTNGGVVLHQLYNPENPLSRSGFPSFVRYRHPSEVQRAYAAEAQRRTGHPLDAGQVERYWRSRATSYILAHKWQSVRNGLRKLGEFSAYTEVPNNRTYRDEQRFSPLLKALPQPFGWLFALGVPGLLLLVRQQARGWLVLAPVSMGLFTIAVFFAEDRFRSNIVAPFVLGTAFWAAWLYEWMRARRWSAVSLGFAASLLLGAVSIWQAARIAPVATNWLRIANGYVLLGDRANALRALDEAERSQPGAADPHELRGLIALQGGDYAVARRELESGLRLRRDRHEVWHNYSLVLEHDGETEAALAAEARAEALLPLPDYRLRMGDLLAKLGRTQEAAELYRQVEQDPRAHIPPANLATHAAARLRKLGME